MGMAHRRHPHRHSHPLGNRYSLCGRGCRPAWLFPVGTPLPPPRSATVFLCAVVVAAARGCAVWARRTDPPRRPGLYVTVGAVGVAAVTAAVLGRTALLAVLGRSDDLTGRIDIWNAV